MAKLNTIKIKQLKTSGKYSDGNGLILKVQATKDPENPNRSWLFRWGAGGKNVIGLGSLRDVSLAEARVLAAAHHRTVSAGGDPRKDREMVKLEAKKRSEALTFAEAAERVIERKRPSWTNKKSEIEWRSSLKRFAHSEIGNTLCSDVTVDQIRNILEPIWKTKHEASIKLRGRIHDILEWAAAEENRSGENPATYRGRLKLLLPAVSRSERRKHFKSLPYKDVPAFFNTINNYPTLSAKALQVCVLTATRTNETIKAQWSEIDFDKGLWIIPKERMKKKKEHRVPLSSQVIEVLRSIAKQGNSPFVFNGRSRKKPEVGSETKHQAISNMAMLNFLQDTLGHEKLTVHGFRSTFRDWAGENTDKDYDDTVIEHALAHKSSDQTRNAYQRGDYLEKRKLLMQDWSDYCYSAITASKKLSVI